MSIELNGAEFDLTALENSTKQVFYLTVKNDLSMDLIKIPVLITKGVGAGPCLLVLGGVHGDEYEGPYAIKQLFDSIEPNSLSGTFIGIARANPPAMTTGTRESPIDHLNLARVFPGDSTGTITEKIAHLISTKFINHSDFLIDLHSSGTNLSTPFLVGYDATPKGRNSSRTAAMVFNAPVTWGHMALSEGRTVSYADSIDVPWLYTECAGGGWLHIDQAKLYSDGVKNVMRQLHMIEGEIPPQQSVLHLLGDGDTDQSLSATRSGYLISEVNLLSKVRRNQVLGRVLGPAGEVLEEITCPSEGIVILMRMTPSVMRGDPTYLVTGTLT